MEKLTYIISQAKRFHFSKWDEAELSKCIEMLSSLNRNELLSLYQSRWILGERKLRIEIFKLLFSDKIGKREDRIRQLDTDKLIEELLDKKGGNVSLARSELKHRYKENQKDDRSKIKIAFAQSSKNDLRWIETQMRREIYEG
jgi:hypothetical protein